MTDGVDIGVEDTSMKNTAVAAKPPYEATPKDASFFFSVLKNCRSKPDVDWDAVAEEQNLKSAAVAKVRYGQIKNKCGMTAVPPGVKAAVTKEPKTPTKRKTPAKASGSAKKDGEIGSGTNTSPSKVVKKRATPKKSVKSAPKVEHDDDEDEDDKNAAAQLSKIEDEDKDVKSFVSKFATVTSDEEAM